MDQSIKPPRGGSSTVPVRAEISARKAKVGDVVRLASGGPDMTVRALSPGNGIEPATADCLWFFDGQEHNGVFPLAALRKKKE